MRRPRAGQNDLVVPKHKQIISQVYEDPDKLCSSGQGNYELTQCPAYESTTSSKPQPTEVDQNSDYNIFYE